MKCVEIKKKKEIRKTSGRLEKKSGRPRDLNKNRETGTLSGRVGRSVYKMSFSDINRAELVMALWHNTF